MRRDEFPIIDKFAEEYANKKVREFADRLKKYICEENCGEKKCVDDMDRCVWYEYVDEVIAEWQKSQTETWNGTHTQVTAPKGTFKQIYDEASNDDDI